MKITKSQIKDIVSRAGKTFIQAFLSAFTIDGFFNVTNQSDLKKVAIATGIACLSAGLSALWNYILSLLSDETETD